MNNAGTPEKIMESLQGFSQKLNPFAQRVSKQLTTVRQWGEEKMGVAHDITELPPDYVELEKHVDALVRTHNSLLKITRTFQNPSYDYPSHLQESIVDFSRTMSEKIAANTFNAEQQGQPASPGAGAGVAGSHPPNATAKTLYHAVARACHEGHAGLGTGDAFGVALQKVAQVEDRVGDARLKMDQEITNKFFLPFNATLNNTLAHALKARKNVNSLRLNLDAAKARARSARPEKVDAAQAEVEQAEDQFVGAVEDATSIMRACIESPEPLKSLSDFVVAQLTYYKEAQEVLSELATELDELQVRQQIDRS